MKRILSSILVFAMIFTFVPTIFAGTTTDYTVDLGAESYTVDPGATVEIPVYVKNNKGTGTALSIFQMSVFPPAGFTVASVVGSTAVKTSDIDLNTTTQMVSYYNDSGVEFTNTEAIMTITLTAPATAGDYEMIFDEELILCDENYDQITSVTAAGATITVTGGSTPEPPVVTVESISVSPETLVIPYGTADVIEYVKSKITVTAAMSDDSTVPNVTNYEIQIVAGAAGDVAEITYEGQTDTVALTQTVVTDVTSSVEEIVVPYGTEDVDAYIRANVGTITVHFSDNTTKVLESSEYTVQIDPGSSAAVYFGTTGRYVKIPVTVVTLDCVMVDLEAEDRTIELPWDLAEEDVDAFIKAKLTVSAIYSYGDPVTVPAADYSIVEFVLSGEPVENAYTVSYEGVVSADNFYVVKGEPPVEVTDIEVTPNSIVIPFGTEDDEAYIKSVITVMAIQSNGTNAPVSDYTVELDGDVASVRYENFGKDVQLVREAVKEIYADKDNIEIPYTVDPADADAVNAYILENVKVYYAYTHNTQDALVAAEDIEIAIEASSGVATLTVGNFNATINVTFEPVPEYILDEVVNETTGKVYAIDGAKLLVFTDVMAGKGIFVNGVPATYVGNNTYAYVVVGDYQITTADMAAAPVAVEFGKLHNSEFVTAFDALLALNKGLGNAVEVFDNNIQNYILADIDGDGVIDARDAQMINNISLGKTVNTWVDGPVTSGGNNAGGSGSSSRPGATPVIPELN